jgi:hypothetical protein
MKKKPFYAKIKNSFFVISLSALFLSCGSFKVSSYFASDGIYVSQSKLISEKSKAITKNNYYKQYFKEAANNGYVETIEEDTYFTDVDSYRSSIEYQDDVVFENNNSQIPWGGEASQTEVVLINNFPNYSWGLAGFGFGYSPFWNNYHTNPYRFGYGGFYSPFRNLPYWNISTGFAGMWGGFNSFYSPFGYYGGFYNPYGFGFRNGYRNNWTNRWNRFDDYYGNNFNQRNKRDYRSTVARIKSGRGEKNYDSPKERNKEKTQNTNSRARDIQNTLNRINLGRGASSIGRNLVVGYDRNRLTSNINNSVRNLRPGRTINSLNKDLGKTQLNTNLTSSPQGLSRGSRSVQNQYRFIERNPEKYSLRTRQRNSSEAVVTPRNSRNIRSSSRVIPRSNRNKSKSVSNNYRTQKSNSYNRSNNSYSNNRPSTQSYNSAGSRSSSSGRSTSSSGSAGRGRSN